jgi:hypothetical protein
MATKVITVIIKKNEPYPSIKYREASRRENRSSFPFAYGKGKTEKESQ